MNEKRSSLRRLGALALANGLLWGTLAAYSLHGSIPYNTIKLPFEKQVDSTVWAPQGWAFFTRDAREEQMRVLVRTGEGEWHAAGHRNADPANWFGASRAGRAIGNEAGSLTQTLTESSWTHCANDVSSCASDAAPIKMANPLPEPTLCGQVTIVLEKPVPWAWATSDHRTKMPVRIARLEVKC